uniref:Sulfite exporter TauE/SafE n=1 Tax=Chaetoceros debilis TaxID=122233 RepID=A0A7S3QDB4_9STRA
MQHQYHHDEEKMGLELAKLEYSGGIDNVSTGAFTELGNDQETLDVHLSRSARTQESLEAQHESYTSEFEFECDSLTPSPLTSTNSPMHLPMSSLAYNDDCESSTHNIISGEDPTISNESSDPVDHDHDDDGDNTAYQHAFRKTCRYLNVAMICLCLVGALLRPMEDKIARRSVSSSQRPLGLQFGAHLGRLSHGMHEFYNSGRLRLLNDGEDGDDNNNNNNQNENNNNNDDKEGDDNQNNNNNGDDQEAEENYYNDGDDDADDANEVEVDDAYYYNASMVNSSYYEEEEEYYYVAPTDDFYNYVDDDDWIERQVFPMEISDYVGFVCVALSIILSIGGGIGPGAILVAVYIIVMDFPPKVAIPLSCVTGLGVNTTGNILNARKRHPLSNRPIIDWDLILVMEPVILLGAIIGTYVNKMLEGKILIVMLVLLLSVIAHNTLKKARRMHHAEELYIKRIMWAKQKRLNVQAPSTSPVYPGSFDNKLAEADPPFVPKVHSLHNDSKSVTSAHKANSSKRHPLLQSSKSKRNRDGGDEDSRSNGSFSSSFNSFIILRKEDAESVKSSLVEEDANPLPQHKITYIITMFFFVIGVNVLKGGIAFESPLGITCGSFGFWLMEFMMACWLIFCTMLAGRYLLRRHAIKEAVGYDYVRGDIKWDVRTVIIYPSACLISGVLSGMFGVGVAIFVGPMLVGIGVNPAVASATCACMNFFTSLAAVSSYVVLGSISSNDREYAIALFLLGVVSGYLGSIFTQKAKSTTKIENNKRLERHSYMAYSMGVVVLVSALSMTLEALLDVINHSFDEDEVDGVCQMERMY